MAVCRTESRCGYWVPEKNRSTARPCPPFAHRIRSNRCHRHSADRTSSCGFISCIICRSKPLTSETPAPTGSGQSSPRTFLAHLSFCSRASSPRSMSENKVLLPLVVIVGPTASGKSALGVELAERLGGEVVACDSTQLYRGFDIGTAKPTPSERHGIPHHLIDVLGPKDEATAGGYRQLALQILEDLRQRKRLPVFTVGTGLYLRALLEGLADVPQRSEALRKRSRTSARPLASCLEAARPGGGRENRAWGRAEAHPRRRSLHSDTQADFRNASNRSPSPGRMARSKSRIDAAARKTQRAHPRQNGRHARAGMDARSASAARERPERGFEAIRFYRLPRIARGAAGRNSFGRSAGSDSAGHAALRQTPAHLVSKGAERTLVFRIWR